MSETQAGNAGRTFMVNFKNFHNNIKNIQNLLQYEITVGSWSLKDISGTEVILWSISKTGM